MRTFPNSRWLLNSRSLHPSLLGAAVLCGAFSVVPTPVLAQDAPAANAPAPAAPPAASTYKQKPNKLTDEKVRREKEREKTKALKGEGAITAAEEFYKDYLIPCLTDPSATIINEAKKVISEDIDTVSKNRNKEVRAAFNTMVLTQVRELISEKAYSPAARINALIIATQLVREANSKGPAVPEIGAQGILATVIDPKEIDALPYIAMGALDRHIKTKGMLDERKRLAFAKRIQPFATSVVPLKRTPEAHQKLLEQVLSTTTTLAITDAASESGKLANEIAVKLIVEVMDDPTSNEWLKEQACGHLAVLDLKILTPEQIAKIQTNLADFTVQSLKDWRIKIASSASSVATGGYPGGSRGPGGPGGPGPGAGPAGGAPGGSEGEGGAPSGMGGPGGYPGAGGAPAPGANNPWAKQPPEVKNARRMAHQRLEKLHLALNGKARKYAPNSNLANAPEKGLVVAAAEADKELIKSVVEKVEAFQAALNEESIADLTTLTTSSLKPIKELRTACLAMTGDEKSKTKEKDPADNDDPFGSGSGAGQ